MRPVFNILRSLQPLSRRGLLLRRPVEVGLRGFASAPLCRDAAKSIVQPVEDIVAFKTTYFKPEQQSLQPLKEAPALYARIHLHNWDMLVTKGDIVKLPVNMKDVNISDVLSFSECSEIGSRNHTLSGGEKGKGRLDPSLFTIKGVVLEKSRVKRSVAERTRRRRRHVRHVVSNNSLTVIRVSELKLN